MKNNNISIRTNDEQHEWLKKQAAKRDLPVSCIIRELINQAMKE